MLAMLLLRCKLILLLPPLPRFSKPTRVPMAKVGMSRREPLALKSALRSAKRSAFPSEASGVLPLLTHILNMWHRPLQLCSTRCRMDTPPFHIRRITQPLAPINGEM